MNGWFVIITGLVLVGVGGFLGFYGSHLNNRADNETASQTLNDKIGEVLTKIADAQSAVPTSSPTPIGAPSAQRPKSNASAQQDTRKELETIRQDFTDWASQFLHNRTAKKLELDRLRADAQTEAKRISDKCRPAFQYAVDVLRGSIAAYNSTAGTAYKATLKELPDNLYDTEGNSFNVGAIEFTPEIAWRINVQVYRPPRDASPPVFFILIPSGKSGEPDDNFRIEVRPTTLLLQTGGGGIAGTANVDGTPDISSYQKPLRTALEHLLEAQITSLTSHS